MGDTQIVIVEDDALMRDRLGRILADLAYEPVAYCENLATAMDYVQHNKVDMALVDLGLPDGNGISLIQTLRALNADVPILVISAWRGEQDILNALNAGASGYVLKERDDMEVGLSIRSALRGGAPIDPFMARRILNHLNTTPHMDVDGVAGATPASKVSAVPDTSVKPPAHPILTPREYDVLVQVASGLTNREIADQMKLSRYTIEGHVKNIYKKLAVRTRMHAINTARGMGLIG